MTSQKSESNNGDGASPFVELDRQTWSRLASKIEQPLNEEDIARIRGLGDQLNMREVRDVYLPLSRLLNLYVGARPGTCTAPPPRFWANAATARRS